MFQYSEEFDFSLDLVKKCGEVIKKAFYSEKKIRYGVIVWVFFHLYMFLLFSQKSAPNDLVTETDQEVEKLLITGLRDKFPDSKFIGEESVAAGSGCVLTEEPT